MNAFVRKFRECFQAKDCRLGAIKKPSITDQRQGSFSAFFHYVALMLTCIQLCWVLVKVSGLDWFWQASWFMRQALRIGTRNEVIYSILYPNMCFIRIPQSGLIWGAPIAWFNGPDLQQFLDTIRNGWEINPIEIVGTMALLHFKFQRLSYSTWAKAVAVCCIWQRTRVLVRQVLFRTLVCIGIQYIACLSYFAEWIEHDSKK